MASHKSIAMAYRKPDSVCCHCHNAKSSTRGTPRAPRHRQQRCRRERRVRPGGAHISFQDPQLIKRSGPLYSFPFLFIAKSAAPALGIARHAIDVLVKSSAGKPARRYTLGERIEAPKVLRDDVYVQEAVGRAETALAAARAYFFGVMGDLWTTLRDGRQPSERQLALFTTAYPHVVGVCVDVVQLVYKAAGGGAVYQKGPLDRCLRDVLTMNQH